MTQPEGTTRTIADLAADIRATNKANGWGEDYEPRMLPGYLALIHSEISEAYEETQPERRAAELGDVIIRALDLGELIQPCGVAGQLANEYGMTLLNDLPTYQPPTWRDALLRLHAVTTAALQAYRKVTPWEPEVINYLGDLVALSACTIVEQRGANPQEIVEGLIAKNKQRGYRHGGRRI